MKIVLTDKAIEDLMHLTANEPAAAKRVFELIDSIQKDFSKGIGKPELLKHNFKGCWSRRITDEHRLVYKMSGTKGVDQECTILACRFHY